MKSPDRELSSVEIEQLRRNYWSLCSVVDLYGDEVEPAEYYGELFEDAVEEERGDGRGTVSINFLEAPYPSQMSGPPRRGNCFGDLFELVDFAQGHPRAYMGDITYWGQSYRHDMASNIVGITIDFDEPRIAEFQAAIADYWSDEPATFGQFIPERPQDYNHPAAENYRLPRPTYITVSGTGLHLTFAFDHPLPLFHSNIKLFSKLKRELTDQVWWSRTTALTQQQQSIWQQYTVIGSQTSIAREFGGTEMARVWRVGEKWDIKKLFAMCGIDIQTFNDGDGMITVESKPKQKPTGKQLAYAQAISDVIDVPLPKTFNSGVYGRWIRKHENVYKSIMAKRKAMGGSNLHNRGFYTSFRNRLWNRTPEGLPLVTFGHRFWCIEALVSAAMTSKDVSYDELERDAYALQPFLNSARPEKPFTREDVAVALERYGNDKMYRFSRKLVMEKCGVPLPETRRNGRDQAAHLKRARRIKAGMVEDQEPFKNPEGRPKGSGTKQEQVENYYAEHPTSTVRAAAAALGISKNTVQKWKPKN